MSKKRSRQRRKQDPAFDEDEHVVFFAEGGETFTMGEHKAAQERASEDDRRWFEEHPQAKGRVRAYIAYELPISSAICAHVLVRQLKPGVRMRQPLAMGWQPFTYLVVDPATGELLGKYSDAEAWQDAKYRELKELLNDMD